MRKIVIVIMLLSSFRSIGQHCPWDCTGMIVLQIDLPKMTIEHLGLVLVDENRWPITDTLFGTGKDTYDECVFLDYDSFTKRRKEKIAIHHWYVHDTLYKFAEGKYIVKYNYCKYRGKKLYIRYLDQHMRSLVFHYIEIPDSNRIHLHNYSDELFNGKAEQMKEETRKNIMVVKGIGM
jgi:hypothetical protein